jgi:hypothetical protein
MQANYKQGAITMIAQGFHGRSFMPWLQVCTAFVIAGCFLPAVGMRWGIFFIPLAGLIPFAIQLHTGYSLDRSWVARYSRREKPFIYWSKVVAALLFTLLTGFGAYKVYESAL